MMTPQEMIEVLQAFLDGHEVQYLSYDRSLPLRWRDASSPGWDFANFSYRVKPTPREFWINTYDTSSCRYVGYLYGSFQEAQEAKPENGNGKTIHVREVLDDTPQTGDPLLDEALARPGVKEMMKVHGSST